MALQLITILFTITLAALEVVTYSGFIAKHIGIPAIVFLLVSLLPYLFSFSLPSKLHKPLLLLSITLTIVYSCCVAAEFATYPNFIFTYLHLNLPSLHLLIAFIWLHYLLHTTKLPLAVLTAALIFFVSESSARSLSQVVRGVGEIIQNPSSSYDEKMSATYPGFYPAMQIVKNLTPSNATLVIPPQGNPWESEGNGAFVTYFLYPRRVIHWEDRGSSSNTPEYILIARGSWATHGTEYGWPKESVDADRLWQFDVKTGTAKEIVKDYNPSTDQFDWGLIEVSQ